MRKSLQRSERKKFAVLQSLTQFVNVLSKTHQPKFKENCLELAENKFERPKKIISRKKSAEDFSTLEIIRAYVSEISADEFRAKAIM